MLCAYFPSAGDDREPSHSTPHHVGAQSRPRGLEYSPTPRCSWRCSAFSPSRFRALSFRPISTFSSRLSARTSSASSRWRRPRSPTRNLLRAETGIPVDNYPVNRDPANCPLCKELTHSGSVRLQRLGAGDASVRGHGQFYRLPGDCTLSLRRQPHLARPRSTSRLTPPITPPTARTGSCGRPYRSPRAIPSWPRGFQISVRSWHHEQVHSYGCARLRDIPASIVRPCR